MDDRQLINEVEDNAADQIYVDAVGQMTNENNPEIFGPELLPGETIVREFRVFQVNQGRNPCFMKFLYCITLGIYYCYINCCQRCRLFHMGNKRTRVAVTDKGRMMLWDSDLEGSRVGLTSGFTSDTTMEWYHIDDLNSLQVLVREENKCGPFKLCGKHSDTVMRLFFGSSYPNASLLHQLGVTDSGAVQGLYEPDWHRADFIIGALKGAAKKSPGEFISEILQMPRDLILNNIGGCYHFCTCGIFYEPVEDIPIAACGRGQFALDIGSINDNEWKDGYHVDDGKAWQELLSLARFIADGKKVGAPLAGIEPNPHYFIMEDSADMEDAAESKLIVNKKVFIDKAKFPLGADEKVIDAIQITPRMSWWECLFVPTVSCKRKYKTDSAAIVTSHRAFSVSEYRTMDSYDFSMNAYFLDTLRGGMVITDPLGDLGFSSDVQTTYGAIRILPVMAESIWPWGAKVPPKLKQRMFTFMNMFERACATEPSIPAPAKGSLPNQEDVAAVEEHVNLWDGEEICSVIRSDNLYNVEPFVTNPCIFACTMGDIPSTTDIVKALTCGCRPWELDQFLVLTTHRMLSFQRVQNTCKVGMCQGKAQLMLWVPLRAVEAMQMRANLTIPTEGCCYKILKACCKCCNKDTATLDVAMGRNGGYGPAPFKIGRVQSHAKRGILEGRSELKHFRAALAYYHSTREINKNHLEPEVTNEQYGQTPFPERLQDVDAVKNPMIGAAGGETCVITVGTTGG